MALISKGDALKLVRRHADADNFELSKNARRDSKELGYEPDDICDVLCGLSMLHCKKVGVSKWGMPDPVATFIASHRLASRESNEPDKIFIEISISESSLYILAFKPDGSPR